MKLVFVAIAVCCVFALAKGTELTEEHIKSDWAAFKTKHSKTYPDEATEAKKYEVFKANLKKITDHNILHAKGEVSHSEGINQFSDLTPEEFASRNHGLKLPETH